MREVLKIEAEIEKGIGESCGPTTILRRSVRIDRKGVTVDDIAESATKIAVRITGNGVRFIGLAERESRRGPRFAWLNLLESDREELELLLNCE